MRAKRLMMWASVLALLLSALPLYAISFYDHPYYDDYNFSADVHAAWQETGSVSAVLTAAVKSAQEVRMTWQGTYTGTFLSNVQPSVFSEGLYWIGAWVLLTAFLACFGFFFYTVFHGQLGLHRHEAITLACLAMTLMLQLMPDVGEAFFWFNGGIGNVFIYSLLVLSFGLMLRLLSSKRKAVLWTAMLAVLMVALGGGSYGGGLFGLCVYGLLMVCLFVKKHPRKWHVLGLWLLFLACFVYSMSAPGNAVRASVVNYSVSPVKAILQAVYHGVALMGQYLRLPLIGVSMLLAPALYRAAKQSRFTFAHPWLMTGLCVALYAVQLVPPLYSIAGIGGGRIEDTYFLCFVTLWFLWLYYLLGVLARRAGELPELDDKAKRGGAILAACLILIGCLGVKPASEPLYGVQHLSGVSATLSLLTGEAAQYDREMDAREALLQDASQPIVTLQPLSSVPAVFMDDLLVENATEDARPALCLYYGKEAILIGGAQP